MATSRLAIDDAYLAKADAPKFADAFARIELHYFVNGGFLPEGHLLQKAQIDKIRSIPTTIVQGRYDVVCPITTAWELHKVFPEAKFVCRTFFCARGAQDADAPLFADCHPRRWTLCDRGRN